jgi:Ca2+-binding EF-hand superfamily protein
MTDFVNSFFPMGTFRPFPTSPFWLLGRFSYFSGIRFAQTLLMILDRQMHFHITCQLTYTVVLLLASGTVLFAQEGMRAIEPMPSTSKRSSYLKSEFALLDSNNDGQISETEFQRNTQTAIEKAERLAKEFKYEAYMVSQLYSMNNRSRRIYPEFSQLDRNADGMVSFHQEFLGFSQLAFSNYHRWDADGDGKITRQEYVKSERAEREQVRPAEPKVKVSQKRLESEFALYDRDENGNISYHEILSLYEKLPPFSYEGGDTIASYVQTDLDSNGAITRNEFLAEAHKRGDDEYLTLEQKVFRLRDLNGDLELSFLEFVQTGENPAREFAFLDKDEDGEIHFDDVKGTEWIGRMSLETDRGYFSRLDANQDDRVSWNEYRLVSPRSTSLLFIDHLTIDNSISKDEWNAIEKEYRAGQSGKVLPPFSASHYATLWFPGIFDLITFDDLDTNKDGTISWKEFRTFPN